MKWTAPRTAIGLRASFQRCVPAVLLGAATVSVLVGTAVADVFRLTPTLFLEQIFVDNIRSSSSDRDADGITAVGLRIDTLVQTDKINALARAESFYNEVWAANDLEGFNARGDAVARVKLYRDQFFVDASARRQQVFLSPTGSGGADFLTGQNQQQETDYSVSPTIETDLFDLADFRARATYAQVFFDEPQVGPLLVPLNDVTLKELSGQLTTGKRASLYEAIVSADYLETDTDFEQRNIIGSLFLNVTEKFSAIGRIGYERITDPTITPIRETIWSVGGRLLIGKESLVQVEYGHRFGDVSWIGEVDLVLSPRAVVQGSYTDTLIPIQLAYLQDIDDLFSQEGVLQIPAPQAPGVPDLTALDEIIRDRNAQVVATYKIDLRKFELSFRHKERHFIRLNDTEKLYEVRLSVDEQLSRSLSYVAAIDFFETYAPLIGNPTSENYRFDLAVRYQLATKTRVTGGYLWRLQAAEDNADAYENVLRFGVEQQF